MFIIEVIVEMLMTGIYIYLKSTNTERKRIFIQKHMIKTKIHINFIMIYGLMFLKMNE